MRLGAKQEDVIQMILPGLAPAGGTASNGLASIARIITFAGFRRTRHFARGLLRRGPPFAYSAGVNAAGRVVRARMAMAVGAPPVPRNSPGLPAKLGITTSTVLSVLTLLGRCPCG